MLVGFFFFPLTLTIWNISLCSLACTISEKPNSFLSFLLLGRVFFHSLLAFIKIFSLILSSFNMIWLGVIFCCLFVYFLHLFCPVFSELSECVLWCLTWIWRTFSVIIAPNISPALSLFLLVVAPLCKCYPISSCPPVLGCSVPFFLLLLHSFSLIFSFGNFYGLILKLESFSSAVSCLLMSPSKAFFISVTVLLLFLISSISLWFFLRLSISLFTLLSAPACWLLFPLEPLAY